MTLYDQYPVFISNSLTGKKEKLQTIHPGRVGMYVCGPTVYNKVHLGNVRTFLTFDIISRYLRYLGYKVRYVGSRVDVPKLDFHVSSAAAWDVMNPELPKKQKQQKKLAYCA